MTLGTGFPQQFFDHENLKNGLKFSQLAVITFRPVEVTSRNFVAWFAVRQLT